MYSFTLFKKGLTVVVVFFTFFFFSNLVFSQTSGRWVVGDFHQHTTFSDGSYSIMYMMQKNAQYGLDWWANSEHGGGFSRNGFLSGYDLFNNLDANGKIVSTVTYWDTYSSGAVIGNGADAKNPKMWRWQSIRDFSYKAIQLARLMYPTKLILQSYEWNVPGHEHCSMGLLDGQFEKNDNCNALAEFEYRFDAGDRDTIGGESQGWTGKNFKNDHAKAVQAIVWLKEKYPNTSYTIIAHPERKQPGKGGYTIADLRDFHTAGPNIAFGFESVPGHQKDITRGGYSNTSVGGGTYGGSGIYSAKVGGLWDAMLTEGRHYWLFSSSDSHDTTVATGGDFFPGEYQKTYTYVSNPKNAQSILDGLRSGNSWVVTGDLIDSLYFSIENTPMGGTANVNGKTVTVKIAFRDPDKNNHNVWSDYKNPSVDHLDLIAGKIDKIIPSTDPRYNVDTVATTKVIARFDAVGGIKDANGLVSQKWTDKGNGIKEMTMTVELTSNMYFRLRGTNLKLNTPNETDGAGNPLSDTLVGGYATNTSAKTFADLWFYSNPIFVKSAAFTSIYEGSKKENNEKYILYPNPSNQEITIQNDVNTFAKYIIYDINGNNVAEGIVDSKNKTIRISDLANGAYLIGFVDEEGLHSQYFIKQ